MSDRMTEAKLEAIVERINRLTNSPLTPLERVEYCMRHQ